MSVGRGNRSLALERGLVRGFSSSESSSASPLAADWSGLPSNSVTDPTQISSDQVGEQQYP
jgi:hypothetical protein